MLMTEAFQSQRDSGLHDDLPLPSHIKQIDGLQILRAVAVLIVSWGHAGLVLVWSAHEQLPDLGVFGIDIFFVISGFILASVVLRTHQSAGPKAAWYFLERRLIRIFPIYWIFAAIGIAVLLHRQQFHVVSFLPIFFLLPFPNYPEMHFIVDFSWTLVFEMFFYYLLSTVQLFTVKRAVLTSIGLLCAAVALGSVISIKRPFLIVAANPILLEFAYGACVALALRAWGRRRALGVSLTVLGIVTALSLERWFRGGSAGMQMILANDHAMLRAVTWGLAATLLVAGVVFWSPSPSSWLGKGSVILGNASYSIYLASGFVIPYFARGVLRLFRTPLPLPIGLHLVYQLLDVVLVFVVGWLFYQLVEWPMLRRLQGLLKAKL
jgi:exopolysaccharide production protein ExoZ